MAEIALGGGLVTAAGTFRETETFPDGTALTSASSSGNAFLVRFALGAAPPPPPIDLVVTETVGVSDGTRLLESLRLLVAEVVAVTDAARFLESIRLVVEERVGVTDRVRFLEALRLAVEERIAVTDDPRMLASLRLLLQETVAALDGAGVARADGSEAVSAVAVRTDGRVSFLGPAGLDVVLADVRVRGTLTVRFLNEAVDLGGAPARAARRASDAAPFRWVLRASGGLSAGAATARFDLGALGDFRRPETVAVHWRAGPDAAFTPLATTYDAASGEAVAELPGLDGELALVGDGVPTDGEPGVPAAFALSPPAPNPTAGAVRLVVDLPEAGDVRLEAFDARGRRVAVLLDGPMPAGRHAVGLRADAFAPGVYVVRLTADAGTASRTLTVVR